MMTAPTINTTSRTVLCERLFDPVAEAATTAVAEAAAELEDDEDNDVCNDAAVVVGTRLADVTLVSAEDVLGLAVVTALMILDALCVEVLDNLASEEVVALEVVRDDVALDDVRVVDDREEDEELVSSSLAMETIWPRRGCTEEVVAVGLLTAGTVTVMVTLATAGRLLSHTARASRIPIVEEAPAATASERTADAVCCGRSSSMIFCPNLGALARANRGGADATVEQIEVIAMLVQLDEAVGNSGTGR